MATDIYSSVADLEHEAICSASILKQDLDNLARKDPDKAADIAGEVAVMMVNHRHVCGLAIPQAVEPVQSYRRDMMRHALGRGQARKKGR